MSERLDRLERLVESLGQRLTLTAQGMTEIEIPVHERLAEIEAKTEVERTARLTAESAQQAAERDARLAIEKASGAAESIRQANERAALAEQAAKVEAAKALKTAEELAKAKALLARPVPPAPPLKPVGKIEIQILKNGDDRIRQFVLKAEGRQDITLDVMRDAAGRVRNLKEK